MLYAHSEADKHREQPSNVGLCLTGLGIPTSSNNALGDLAALSESTVHKHPSSNSAHKQTQTPPTPPHPPPRVHVTPSLNNSIILPAPISNNLGRFYTNISP